jgi:hypothetical protein
VIGMGLACARLAIALNRHIADSSAGAVVPAGDRGIAWVPLTYHWFGIGNGSVIFVIANTSSSRRSTTVVGRAIDSRAVCTAPCAATAGAVSHCSPTDPAGCARTDPARHPHVDGVRLGARSSRRR